MSESVYLICTCLLIAWACAVAIPRAIKGADWQVGHASLALALWMLVFFIGHVALICAVVAAAVFASTISGVDSNWQTLMIGPLGWTLLFASGGLISLVIVNSTPVVQLQRKVAKDLASLVHTRGQSKTLLVAEIDCDAVAVFAVPGKVPAVCVSSRVLQSLTPLQMRAVVAHEFAHLRWGHPALVHLAKLNLACFPWIPSARWLLEAVTLLIELMADDAAARQVGPAHIANALQTLGILSNNETMIFRARRLSLRRWPSNQQRRVPRAMLTMRFTSLSSEPSNWGVATGLINLR